MPFNSVDNSGYSVGLGLIPATAFRLGYRGGRWFESTAAHQSSHNTNPGTRRRSRGQSTEQAGVASVMAATLA